MTVKFKIITTFEALEKAKKYCAYSERSQYDVRKKIELWNIDEPATESIIATLIEENFLNEDRFAKAYARGKMNINHWGRVKIKMGLRQHQVSPRCIQDALKSLIEEEYLGILKHEALKKIKLLNGTKSIKQQKTATFLISKGFETDLSYQIVHELINQNE